MIQFSGTTKGLRLDFRDQPWLAGLLPDFSYDYRYCSFVTMSTVTNGHDHDRYSPVLIGTIQLPNSV
jgi:hypothetical protein